MSDEVRYASEGGLARITLARPPLNILTTRMLDDLTAALERAEADGEVRLVRIDAEGKAFSAGVDVGDHLGDKVTSMMDALARLFAAYDSMAKPSLSVVHGAALGGGWEVAMAADLCFASERASFGQPEIRLGLFAPPASVLLPRLAGERRALWLLLSGDTVSAATAREAGMVNEVFAPERLAEEVAAIEARLLGLSGSALRHAKGAVRAARGLPVAEAHRTLHRLYLDELMATADAEEGLQAFVEKRAPRWSHA